MRVRIRTTRYRKNKSLGMIYKRPVHLVIPCLANEGPCLFLPTIRRRKSLYMLVQHKETQTTHYSKGSVKSTT
jgi:hypothetical protein